MSLQRACVETKEGYEDDVSIPINPCFVPYVVSNVRLAHCCNVLQYLCNRCDPFLLTLALDQMLIRASQTSGAT